MCGCTNKSISTHVQRPAEGVLLHTALLLCILTLLRQVVVQQTIELLQSWQPAHQRDTETEEGLVIVCTREEKERFFKSILLPSLARIQR